MRTFEKPCSALGRQSAEAQVLCYGRHFRNSDIVWLICLHACTIPMFPLNAHTHEHSFKLYPQTCHHALRQTAANLSRRTPGLTKLNLGGLGAVSDGGLAHISGLPSLEHLNLARCNVRQTSRHSTVMLKPRPAGGNCLNIFVGAVELLFRREGQL